jgi:hypothetical protein
LPFLSGTARRSAALEVEMKKAIRVPMVIAAIAAVVVSLTPSAAQAQVRVEGRFRLPHGEIAVGVGDPYYDHLYYGAPAYPIGSYVPYGYRVIEDPYLGYGFYGPVSVCRVHHARHAHWIPVRHHRARWVVIERPHFSQRYYRRGHDGGRYGDRRYDNRRYNDRRYTRRDGRRYSNDPYYDFNRQYRDRSYRNRYDRR